MHIPVLLLCLLSFARANSADQPIFKPLTYGLNFKAYFRVQAFASEQPIYSGDIYESYHSQLGTCLIKQTISEPNTGRSTSKRFLCDSRAKRLVEFTEPKTHSDDPDTADPFQDNDFYLYENGGSNSYRADKLQREFRRESVRLVPEGASIDSLLLMAHDQEDLTLPDLDLDQFMTPDCLAVLRRTRLHYVSGLTRLLHLIECRRSEFKQQQARSTQGVELTRGQTRQMYRAKRLEAMPLVESTGTNAIRSLDVLVTVHKPGEGSPGATLEPGAIPLSIVLTCEPALSILINVYQFESVGLDDHLSEAASGHSTYLMPLAQPNLSHLLASIQYDSEQKQAPAQSKPEAANRPARSFSFEATLTGSHLSQFYQDPIEMSVSYDAQLGALATWWIFTDRSQSDGLTGWVRPTIRRLHDSSSGLKFHLMESNFGYVSQEQQSQSGGGDQEESNWRTCATDKLSEQEITQLQEGSDGYLFDLTGATYMGEALVRGIRCQVYERRLFELPAMLGVSENDYVHLGAHLAQSKLYLNLYAYAQGDDDLASARFARLEVRIVSLSDEAQQRSLTLEVSAFDWSPSGVQSRDLFTGENLLARTTQECLLMVPGARHLDMELWFGLADDTRQDLQSLAHLASNREARDHSMREMLAKSALGLSAIQQVDLVTEVHLPNNHQQHQHSVGFDPGQSLYAKFSLYELWSDSAQEEFIGYAKSLTLRPQQQQQSLTVGARSFSYAECKWRALHSLLPDRKRSELNRRDDDDRDRGDLRLFMFCPARLVCILGDATWAPMGRQRPLKLDNLLEYPYVAPTPDDDKSVEQMAEDSAKCVVGSVLIKQQVGGGPRQAAGAINTPNRPQLDWWLINGASGLGRASESLALQKVRELRLELKVKGSSSSLFARDTSCAAAASTLGVKVNKIKLSNRVFTSRQSDGGGSDNESEWKDVSLLVKPLAGLAYLPVTASSDTQPAPGGSGSGAIISSQPLVVASLAECSRACLRSHECQSFSACHQSNSARYSVSCVLARLDWSRESEFHELVRRAEGKEQPTLAVTVQDGDGDTKVEVLHLRRSRLCSIRIRAQLDLYRMTLSHLDYVPGLKYLIPARSPEHCARMCQERAQLMRELLKAKNGGAPNVVVHATGLGSTLRSAACHEFRFAAEGSYCKLMPLQNHWADLGLRHLLPGEQAEQQQPALLPSWHSTVQEKGAAMPTLNRWLRWFSAGQPLAEWLAQLRVQSLSEADHYELDFEQIFQAQRNRRLVLADGPQEQEVQFDELAGSRPQVRLTQYGLYACAKRCLQLTGCRSFDVELPSATTGQPTSGGGGQQRASVCQLNVISAADLRANPSAWPSFELEQVPPQGGGNSTTEWWHYEPSELALYMISDPSEPGLTTSALT